MTAAPSTKVRNSDGKPCYTRGSYDPADEVSDIFGGYVFFVNVRTGKMYAIPETKV